MNIFEFISVERIQKMLLLYYYIKCISLFFALVYKMHIMYNIFCRARRGISGALYLQTAIAGYNSRWRLLLLKQPSLSSYDGYGLTQ